MNKTDVKLKLCRFSLIYAKRVFIFQIVNSSPYWSSKCSQLTNLLLLLSICYHCVSENTWMPNDIGVTEDYHNVLISGHATQLEIR